MLLMYRSFRKEMIFLLLIYEQESFLKMEIDRGFGYLASFHRVHITFKLICVFFMYCSESF